ncbi:CHASE domain-containing protein [Noviherbaspirillum denitrificans]|uniref:Histidine kinase n=1 Tax=Noviherbaspirillum denitrificans TaxID=1968433 RepID=A0A254TEQ8_9BURK|nr:CHASE domain-containing protein [Noviherbaspirillum denitrificans]OWW21149.1 hypothetical protein AYR66_18390 [Noviherbaspirillum denitrificans]
MEPNRLRLIRAYSLGALFAGICVTLVLGEWISNAEQREREIILKQEARERVDAFVHGIENAMHALDTVNQLFATLADVSREQFSVFTQPILDKYPYVLSFAYQRYLSGSSRKSYETSMRRTFGDFIITDARDGKRVPAIEKSRYRVVHYISPQHGNEQVLGIDASSIPEMEEAALRSRATGTIASTRLIPLVKENGRHLGFMLLKPVVRRPPPDAQRYGHAEPDVRGFTVAAFNASDLAHRIMEQGGFLGDETFLVQIYSGDRPDQGNRIFPRPAEETRPGDDHDGSRDIRHHIDVGGVPWTVVVSAPKEWMDAAPVSRLTYVFGFILTGMLVAFIHHMLHRATALRLAVEALKRDGALRQRAETALRNSESELRQLATHQLRVREDERKHIAREIHDDLGQNLLVLRMDVGALAHDIGEKFPDGEARMDLALKHIDATIKSVREIINHLRPSVLDLGVFDALHWLTRHMNKLGKVHFTLECQDENAFLGLKEDDAISLFRAIQEAMTNVIRHAEATTCVVRIQHGESKLRIEVSDDGHGHFPIDRRKPRSFGLIGIRERITAMGGEMSIVTTEGKGTVLQFTLPASTLE